MSQGQQSSQSVLVADGSGATSGYLRCAGQSFAFSVVPARDGAPATLHGDAALRAALAGHEDALRQRLDRNAGDAAGLVAELLELLERRDRSDAPRGLPSAGYYELLIEELDAVGWDTLTSVSPGLDALELSVDDAAGRVHTLGLRVPADYPRAPPVAHVALPVPFALHWPDAVGAPQAGGLLRSAIAQFREALVPHQALWDQLDEIDELVWVLEPKVPTRDLVKRRVAIGSHCSMQMTLHSAAPAALPELQFFGADRVIAPLRRALNANLSLWRQSRSVRLNLEAVLQLSFPAPQLAATAGAEEYSVECAICYGYHLDGDVPECACDSCAKPFHRACLCEWLRALPTTQTSFGRLFGECPYCSKPIAVEPPPAKVA